MIRHPSVSGQFYSSNATKLRTEIGGYLGDKIRSRAVGVIAPHAGYMFSGAIAGSVFGSVEIPETVIIIGPNHTGFGAPAALYPDGEWVTPIGSSRINNRLSQLIKEKIEFIEEDAAAHHYEHSLEVQLPFLQVINPEVTIVPLCLGTTDFNHCSELGTGIAKAIRELGEKVLIIASSDMTHYESAAAAKRKDDLALREVLKLDAEGLMKVCRKEGITMCGVIPSAVMIVACRDLGATEAKLVDYATSGDITGDTERVVGYAGVTIS